MRLGLSSAAAPDAPLSELLAACARRGLATLELEEGHGHGLEPGLRSLAAPRDAAARIEAAGVSLAGFRVARGSTARLPGSAAGATEEDAADAATWARFARALGAPALVPLHGPVDRRAALALRRAGVPVLGILPPDPFADPALASLVDPGSEGLPLAWDADGAVTDLDVVAPRLLDRAGARLRHIRIPGGGPESAGREGLGVGTLAARLALAGYAGTVALAPSSARFRVVWDAWLGRRGGWGCGSAGEDRSLVSLGARTERRDGVA
ncbi:MAG: hypothetical protein GWM90_02720 [Gemmatimonadetes bacterium]|nr:hypothetical protein [Gemmatimonadota bacterium]NIQ52533.1 hypothetical protein [Gemmatimonadota bacterium]NIU72671.1 hypothetical protein [Gammaproteobacteria bacterium]NIX43077.1 hypothetical protein [Gemmatimonadota bacterium]NIY07237.1 hypothetical protein [Gemmatimonadota bacterium]